MSQVIYARVPTEVKIAADGYARAHDRSAAAAIADLIERGLAVTVAAQTQERRVGELETGLEKARAELAEARTLIAQLEERRRTLEAAYEALAGQLAKQVGSCPACHASVSGEDLIVTGRCPNAQCRKGLSSLFPAQAKGLDERELLLLIGAIGLVLGIAMVQAKTS